MYNIYSLNTYVNSYDTGYDTYTNNQSNNNLNLFRYLSILIESSGGKYIIIL